MPIQNTDLDSILGAIYANDDFGTIEYEEIVRLTGKLAHEVSTLLDKARSDGRVQARSRLEIRRIGDLIRRRRFAEFRECIRATTTFERFLVEVFLAARIRLYVLAYLSVQEGEDFEGGGPYETLIPEIISTSLRDIGRRSNFEIRLNYRYLKLNIDLDPTSHLRAIYTSRFMMSHDTRLAKFWRGVSVCYQVMLFRVKCALAFNGAYALAFDLRKNSPDPISAVFGLKLLHQVLKHQLPSLFPETQEFTEEQWHDLAARIRSYFPDSLRTFFRVTPRHSLESKGLIKMLKVAVGVIAGRTSTRSEHESDPVDFVFNTLRIAYCWGVTYPLVDNVLDSNETSPAIRNELTRSLMGIFAARDEGADEPKDRQCSTSPAIVEVEDRLLEAMQLIPSERICRVKRILRHLYQAHRHDARRRLHDVTCGEEVGVLWHDVLVDTMLKSALVRLATMELCVIDVDRATRDRSLSRALYNQLGDDLWDIYEDTEDERVTPFTLALKCPGVPDPFALYVDYGVLLSSGLSRRRRTAVFLGVCETLKDALDTLKERPLDHLGVASSVKRLLELSSGLDQESLGLQSMPHVDFDAIIFLLEDTLFGIVGLR